jgi:hypothetical protein
MLTLHGNAIELEAYGISLLRRPAAERHIELQPNGSLSDKMNVAFVPMTLGSTVSLHKKMIS